MLWRTPFRCSRPTRPRLRCWRRCSTPSRSPARSPTRRARQGSRTRSWRAICATLSSATVRPSMRSGSRSMCAASWPRRKRQRSPVSALSWASSTRLLTVATSRTTWRSPCPAGRCKSRPASARQKNLKKFQKPLDKLASRGYSIIVR